MGLLSATCSFTRFRILDTIPQDVWMQLSAKLKQFAFQDIDDIPEERGWGWVNFEDMLDTEWHTSPAEKAGYITFALRLDTRRVPAAVLKKHMQVALKEEHARIEAQGKKFVSRERRNELRDQVRMKLMNRFLPIPAVFEVVWATETNMVYLASTQSKLIDLFLNHFTLTFNLHLEALTPYALAASMLDDAAVQKVDVLEPTAFV